MIRITQSGRSYKLTQKDMAGISVSKICVPFGGGGIDWSTYWATLNLRATAISNTRIDLTWIGNAPVTVQRSTDGINYSDIGTATNGYSDTGLTAGTLYYYRLSGGGTFSDFDLATTDTIYVLVQDFDSIGDFTQITSFDSLEVSTDRFIDGDGALKIDSSGTGSTMQYIPASSFKFNGNGHIRYFRPAGINASINIRVSTSVGMGAGTWTQTGSLMGAEGAQDQATFRSGWNNIILTRANFTVGTPALLDNPDTNFTTIWIGVAANDNGFYLDSLRFGDISKAAMVITFDDGDDSIFDINEPVFGAGKSAFDYMVDNGIKATSYIISDKIDTVSYLTSAQLATIYAAGWDLGNHTSDHSVFTALTDEEIETKLGICRDFLDARGYTRGSLHVSYPGGEFTLDTHPALLSSLGYKTGRQLISSIQNTQVKQSVADNLFNLYSHSVNSTVTAADITNKIDEVIVSGKMLSIYIHGLGTPESASVWDPAKLKTVIDYIVTKRAAGALDCLTISEWYKNRT